jgi:hypothetical protein
MNPSRLRSRWMLLGVFVVIIAGALGLIFAEHNSSPTPIKADSVVGSADSTTLTVRFPWSASTWCAGQFTVRVTGSDVQVSVANVLDKGKPAGTCRAVQTVDEHASVQVTLDSKLGDRKVVRLPDGATLPVQARRTR